MNRPSIAALTALFATLAGCGGADSGSNAAPNIAFDLGGYRVFQGGAVAATSTETCPTPACRRCPDDSFADVIYPADTSTAVAVICYPTPSQTFVVTDDGNLNINARGATVTIDLSEIADATFHGDVSINDVASATIYGATSTRTLVRGNLNLHAGDIRVVNLDVVGDVSFNHNRHQSALIDSVVRGNLNVHVRSFVAVNVDVFGDLNVNRADSIISSVGYGKNVNIHDPPRFCERLHPFDDLDADGAISADERGSGSACP